MSVGRLISCALCLTVLVGCAHQSPSISTSAGTTASSSPRPTDTPPSDPEGVTTTGPPAEPNPKTTDLTTKATPPLPTWSEQSELPATLYGFVTAGPTCPVERLDEPCPPSPVGGSVVARGQGQELVGRTQTDGQGYYRLALPPGTYTLVVETGAIYPRCEPVEVTLARGARTRADITCDTGIR